MNRGPNPVIPANAVSGASPTEARVEKTTLPAATQPDFKSGLLEAIPSLRAFALSLAYQPDRADDLVQETLVKAWANQHMFQPNTNLKAWLFTILRNQFYTEFRKRRFEVPDSDGYWASQLSTQPTQGARLEFALCRRALKKLPDDQREALLLVGVSGLSYEEAAQICGVALGTIKSRINRARVRLAELMNMSSQDDFDNDTLMKAAAAPAQPDTSSSRF